VKDFAVIGLGRFGETVATALRALGHEVMGVDHDATRTQALADALTHVVQADATQEGVLADLGLGRFEVVVVAMGADVEASILVTVMLKELGVKKVVARASSALHGKVLSKVGADEVVFPERDMGFRVAQGLVNPNVLEYFQLSPHYSVVEIKAPKFAHGRTLSQLNLRARFGVNVILIRHGDEINASPGADDVIKEGDLLVVSGPDEGLRRMGGLG
jgi:trk system potassium uptake protein TrkA